MRMAMHSAAVLGAALAAALVLSGCPAQPSYPATITPIYAATAASGLFVYNGSSWTPYTNANTSAGLASDSLSSLAVSGSGAYAEVFVGTIGNGVSVFNGSTWSNPSSGLGTSPINRLVIGSTVYAATFHGLSAYNLDGYPNAWTNDLGSTVSFTVVNDVAVNGSYTYIAADTLGLIIDNRTGTETQVPRGTIVPGANTVQSVLVDFNGDVIVGTDAGLAVEYYGSTSWTPLLSGPSITQIRSDPFGNVFVSAKTTNAGVYIFSLSSGTLTLAAHGFLGTDVSCVAVDGTDTIYAGTATGLLISKDGGSTWTTQLSPYSITAVTTTAPLYQF